jgi:hypothetical protein
MHSSELFWILFVNNSTPESTQIQKELSMQKHLITIFSAMLAVIIFLAGYFYTKPGDVPKASSYQAHNMVTLKTAQSKDLLLCETKDDSSQPKVQRALLVDKNDGERLAGTVLGQWTAIRTEPAGLPILVVSTWQCKFRIVKDAVGKDALLTIIRHGPDKLAQVN